MRKHITTRRSEQAAHQRAYRTQQKALRKPSRDDVARVFLHLMMTDALVHNRDNELVAWCDQLVSQLVSQGFDESAAHRRIDQLIEQYHAGWDFLRKPHLTRPNAG